MAYFYTKLKANAKQRGKEFTLTKEEFEAFCNETKYLELKGKSADSYTIDRIDASKGYSIDNIQILTLRANGLKGVRDYYGELIKRESMGEDVPEEAWRMFPKPLPIVNKDKAKDPF